MMAEHGCGIESVSVSKEIPDRLNGVKKDQDHILMEAGFKLLLPALEKLLGDFGFIDTDQTK